MKKAFLSIGAIMLSGLALASCDFSKGGVKALSISKPKEEGKTVDEVNVKISALSQVSINNSDSFYDAYFKLNKLYYSIDHSESYDESTEERKGIMTYKANYILSSETNLSNSFDNGNIYKKQSMVENNVETEEFYYNIISNPSKQNVNFYYDNNQYSFSKQSYDSISNEKTEKELKTIAGTANYYNDDSKLSVDTGAYLSTSSNLSIKSKSQKRDNKQQSEIYEYVNDSEKPTDSDYNKEFYGYDTDDQRYSYTLEDYYTDPLALCSNIDNSLSNYIDYDDRYKDFYDYNFKLTDNYIILTGTSKMPKFATYTAYSLLNEDATEDEISAKAKQLMDNELKGSYSKFEIWINYTKLKTGSTDIYEPYITYYKTENVIKMDYRSTYDEGDSYYKRASEAVQEKIKGTKYSIKMNQKEINEYVAVTNDDYSKRIDNFRNKCKKNNIFDKIELTYDREDE